MLKLNLLWFIEIVVCYFISLLNIFISLYCFSKDIDRYMIGDNFGVSSEVKVIYFDNAYFMLNLWYHWHTLRIKCFNVVCIDVWLFIIFNFKYFKLCLKIIKIFKEKIKI